MSANLQGAMEDLITVFYKYSGKEGDKYKLNKKELKNLLHEELSEFLAVSFQLTTRTYFYYVLKHDKIE